MPRVIQFQISADDPERVAKFYTDVFGWQIQQFGDMEYWNVVTGTDEDDGPGINGGIFLRKGLVGHVNVVAVDDIDAYQEKVLAAGGEIALPKMAIPGVGYIMYVKDTEQSIVGITQLDMTVY